MVFVSHDSHFLFLIYGLGKIFKFFGVIVRDIGARLKGEMELRVGRETIVALVGIAVTGVGHSVDEAILADT